MTDLALTGTKLTIARGERVLLRGLDLTVAPGDALMLTGPNGAGKTSLLRALAGLLRPLAGAVTLRGLDPAIDGAAVYGAELHFVGHRDPVKGQLTVRENLGFWVRLCGQRPDGLDEALGRFGLGALGALPASFLSQGQRRRLSLSRLATLFRPLWLLDEPAAGLDRDGRESLAALIAAHRRNGGMVVMASHGEFALADARALALGPDLRSSPC